MTVTLLPNRIAVALTAVAALFGGLAPVVANLDLSSTAGVVAGLLSLTTVVNKWLEGWQKHEARQFKP
jgi:hypothetical protein